MDKVETARIELLLALIKSSFEEGIRMTAENLDFMSVYPQITIKEYVESNWNRSIIKKDHDALMLCLPKTEE